MSLLADVILLFFAPVGRLWACAGAAFCSGCLGAAHAAVLAGARRRNARVHAYANVCAEAASAVKGFDDVVENAGGNDGSSGGGSSSIEHQKKGHLNESGLLADKSSASSRSTGSNSSNSSSASSSCPATPERKLSSSSQRFLSTTITVVPPHAIQVVASAWQAGLASWTLHVLLSALMASSNLSACHSPHGRRDGTIARFLYLLFGPAVLMAAAETFVVRFHPRARDIPESNVSSGSNSTSGASTSSSDDINKRYKIDMSRRSISLCVVMGEVSRAVAFAVAAAAAGWLLLYGEEYGNEDDNDDLGDSSNCGGSGAGWWTLADGGGVNSNIAGQRRLLWALALMVALNNAARGAAAAALSAHLMVDSSSHQDDSSSFDHRAASLVDAMRCFARPRK